MKMIELDTIEWYDEITGNVFIKISLNVESIVSLIEERYEHVLTQQLFTRRKKYEKPEFEYTEFCPRKTEIRVRTRILTNASQYPIVAYHTKAYILELMQNA